MRKTVSVEKSNTLINPGCVVLASVTYEGFSNIITIAWQTTLSIKPRLVGISVGFKRYSHDMIRNAGEFIINVPGRDLLDRVHGCGRVSGRKYDKYERFELHPQPGKKVASQGIEECLGSLECKVVDEVTTGDHTFFVGEVLHAEAEESVYDFQVSSWKDKPESELLYHLGGNRYTTGHKWMEA
ncbi:MAG TPA: flavin reductase family protein [Bacteroidales bacterium]|nr:flavin reductase family protein [Bacteroidales bacterium]